MESLWGESFNVVDKKIENKKILSKIKEPKVPKIATEKKLSSSAISLDEKLIIIKENVEKILGRYTENTIVIKTKDQLTNYIDKAIANNVIAIDTETNNSLDPITCKLAGVCIYTPGEKNAYIPINHIDRFTQERLPWQLTEQDIRDEFNRLYNTKIIMHNGKFDYQVLKCTCDLKLNIYWDTLIGAKVLDENEKSAGLKQQYISKIDPSVDKYSIDALFESIEYLILDPDLFALYAATDSFMTYKLYEWQKPKLESFEFSGVYNLFKNVEMPLVTVLAEMELNGMEVDQEYGKLLSNKYHKKLDLIDSQIAAELVSIKDKIDAWRLTSEANYHPPKKIGDGISKSKSEQLCDPINLASPTQLAILFYDVLKAPAVNKKSPRGTGEDDLNAIAKLMPLNIFNLLIERRACVKLLTTYIDVIPDLAKRWPDGRVRTHFNQYGAATGRLSSSEPINFQNIPAHNKEIRMLFKSKVKFNAIEIVDNYFDVNILDDVDTPNGWKQVKELNINDEIILSNNIYPIKNICCLDKYIRLYI